MTSAQLLHILAGIGGSFTAIGFASAVAFARRRNAGVGLWHAPQSDPFSFAHGDVPTPDPRFHFELAGALRGDAGAGCDFPSCNAGARTLIEPRMTAHG